MENPRQEQEPNSQEQGSKYPLAEKFLQENSGQLQTELEKLQARWKELSVMKRQDRTIEDTSELKVIPGQVRAIEKTVKKFQQALNSLVAGEIDTPTNLIGKKIEELTPRDRKPENPVYESLSKILQELKSGESVSQTNPEEPPIPPAVEPVAGQKGPTPGVQPEGVAENTAPEQPAAAPERPKPPETENRPLKKAEIYFSERLSNAENRIKEMNAQIYEEEAKGDKKDSEKIERMIHEMNYRGAPAVREYRMVLKEMREGNIDRATNWAADYAAEIQEKTRAFLNENKGKPIKELEEDEEYKRLAGERVRLAETIAVLRQEETRQKSRKNSEPVPEPPKPVHVEEADIIEARRAKSGDVGSDEVEMEPDKPIAEAREPKKTKRPEKVRNIENEKTEQQKELLESFSKFAGFIKYRIGNPEMADENKDAAKAEYSQSCTAYQKLTGGDLNKELRDRATNTLPPGCVLRTGEQALSAERKEEMKKHERERMMSEKIREAWAQLPDEEKNRWKEISDKDETTKNKEDGPIRQFMRQSKAYFTALEQKDFHFYDKETKEDSRNVYFEMFKEGFDPRTLKHKGWFTNKVEIRRLDGKKEMFSLEQFNADMEQKRIAFEEQLEQRTNERMAKEYAEGRNSWRRMKIKAAGDIVLETTKDYQAELGKPAAEIEQSVRPEEIMSDEEMEREERQTKERRDQRLSQLAGKIEEISRRLALAPDQNAKLKSHIDSGEKLPPKFPVPKDIVKLLREKKAEIEKEQKSRLGFLSKRKMAKLRLDLGKMLASI